MATKSSDRQNQTPVGRYLAASWLACQWFLSQMLDRHKYFKTHPKTPDVERLQTNKLANGKLTKSVSNIE